MKKFFSIAGMAALIAVIGKLFAAHRKKTDGAGVWGTEHHV